MHPNVIFSFAVTDATFLLPPPNPHLALSYRFSTKPCINPRKTSTMIAWEKITKLIGGRGQSTPQTKENISQELVLTSATISAG